MYCVYDSPLGEITIAADERSVIRLSIAGQTPAADGDLTTLDRSRPLQLAKIWLDQYFSGRVPDVDVPIDARGSAFRRGVWQALCEIPYGHVTTYGDIARKIARNKGVDRMSAQAVGGAVGHNPISIIIPCHRVIGSDGSLTGYAGGIGLKEKLLEIEGMALPLPSHLSSRPKTDSTHHER